MAVHSARAFGTPFDFQLDLICGAHKACATAMHSVAQIIGHRVQIDLKSELIFGVELLQIYVSIQIWLTSI